MSLNTDWLTDLVPYFLVKDESFWCLLDQVEKMYWNFVKYYVNTTKFIFSALMKVYKNLIFV